MDKFIKEFHGRVIRDDCAYMSEEAKSFFRKMKSYIKRCVPDYSVENWRVGHYNVSFFLVKEYEQPIYVSYDLPRGYLSLDLFRSTPLFGVLYRRAKDIHDYRGEQNHFCSMADIGDSIAQFARQ